MPMADGASAASRRETQSESRAQNDKVHCSRLATGRATGPGPGTETTTSQRDDRDREIDYRAARGRATDAIRARPRARIARARKRPHKNAQHVTTLPARAGNLLSSTLSNGGDVSAACATWKACRVKGEADSLDACDHFSSLPEPLIPIKGPPKALFTEHQRAQEAAWRQVQLS